MSHALPAFALATLIAGGLCLVSCAEPQRGGTAAAPVLASLAAPALVGFAPDLTVAMIRCRGAQVVVVDDTWQVDFPAEGAWPGIILPGPWDLSAFQRVVAEVENRGPGPMSLELRLDNLPATDWAKALSTRTVIAPGETATLVLPLVRRRAVGDYVVLDGMRGRPPGFPASRGLDLTQVAQLSLTKIQDHQASTIRVRRIAAEGAAVAIDTVVRLPLVDRFGQDRHAQWTGKITSVEDLRVAQTVEVSDLAAHPAAPGRDRFGGWADGPQLAASGRFRREKLDGRWHLVDPDGRLFFSLGMNHVNVAGSGSYTPVTDERQPWFEELPTPNDWTANGRFYLVRRIYTGDLAGRLAPCFSFNAWNLARTFGSGWEAAAGDLALRRLASWGFTTIGNWSDARLVAAERIPYTVGVALAGCGARVLGGGAWKVGSCWDPFDPAFANHVANAIAGVGAAARSPWCVGVFVDNELYWDEDLGGVTLRAGGEQPAKQELVRWLRTRHASPADLNRAWGTEIAAWEDLLVPRAPTPGARADLDAFSERIADAYFATVQRTLDAAAPGCLYLGARFFRVSPQAFAAAARHCDVVSFNLYRNDLTGFRTPTSVDVPLLVGEFHFGAADRGMWSGGLVPVASQGERAERFSAYVGSALRDPRFVGVHWFEYNDQPLTGRAFDGENYAHGFVTVTGTPYPELVTAARELGAAMYRLRCE